MSDEEKELAIALPGEWTLKKTFGPLLGEIGKDLKRVYAAGRDKIIIAAVKKIKDKDEGKMPNLRVTRDVFWNGSFTDEAICAEYFGGIFASSRSEDGKDDSAIYYTDVIKSLSSKQLTLHYIFYHSLNQLLIADPSKSLNAGMETELGREKVFFAANEVHALLETDFGRDLHAVHAKGLIGNFRTNSQALEDGKEFPYLQISPSSLGVQLYAVANNLMDDWRNISQQDFGSFDEIKLPQYFSSSLDGLLNTAGLKKK